MAKKATKGPCSDAGISRRISAEMKKGHKQDQSIAIAFSKCEASRKKK